MSKKSNNQLDVLGEAHLPADLVTPTDGSNFGLDGFPQLDYNSGLLDQFFDETMLAELPEGEHARDPGKMSDEEFFQDVGGSIQDPDNHLVSDDEPDAAWFADDDGVEGGMHLGDYVKSGGIQDLSWLDLNEQDADRLPKSPTNTAIPELEEAWGTERRTDGFSLSANAQDLDELKYWESTQGGGDNFFSDDPAPPSFHYSSDDLSRVLRKAMRRSAASYPLKEIFREAAESLEHEAHRIAGAMTQIKEEHGLTGKVFIRASAYPGLYRGKDWSKSLKKAKFARYVIVDKRTLEGSTFIQRGVCTITGKKAVLEVPWEAAYKMYKPHLEGAGRKVATGDPRLALRRAFRSTPEQLARPSTHLPKHVTPSERVSSDEAARQLAAVSTKREVITYTSKRAAQSRAAAWRRINAWIESGLIPRERAMSVVGDDVTGAMLLHRVAALIVQTKGAAVFSGLPNDVRPLPATKDQVKAALAGWTPPPAIDITHRAKDAASRQVLSTLTRWVRAGFLTRDQASKIAKANVSPESKLKAASKLITSSRAATDYSGVVNDRRVAPENDPRALRAALDKAQADKRAMQARINELASNKRADTTRAAKKIKAAKDLVAVIEGAIGRGVRGAPLRDLIRRTIPKSQMKLAGRFLVPLLERTKAHKDTPKTARTYQGAAMRPHQATRTASTAPAPRKKEAADAVRFCKMAMHQGLVGNNLTRALKAKFAPGVLTAAKTRLNKLRKAHEGGAGHIYVDASAYATKTGTKGCERGGAKHRSDGTHFVLAMERCGGCALAALKSDGSVVCRNYNKEVLGASEVPEEVKGLMRANVAEASMSEGEKTASMFAPSYDPDEFNLSNSPLNDIDFHKEADDEDVSFSFGGMEF
jgi:hypothetical protein